jgi:hypothetical protein
MLNKPYNFYPYSDWCNGLFTVQLEDDLSGKISIFDSNMSTCVLFLSIFVLLLLLTFLTFRVSYIFFFLSF